MKKIILPFIISFILLAIMNQSLAVTATVSVTAVRIRETASTDSNIVTNVYQEDKVEILEENGEWYKVKYGEKVGYAKAEFFKKQAGEAETVPPETTEPTNNTAPQEPVIQNPSTQEPVTSNPPAQTDSPESQTSTQNTVAELKVGGTISLTNAVKVRLIPNLSTNAKIEIAKGSQVAIEAKLGNWYKIADETTSGWVTESKLTAAPIEPPVETAPEVPNPPEPPENTPPAETVTPEPPTEQPVESPAETTTMHKTAVVIVETARVRDRASTDGSIVAVLDEDDVVTITGEEGKFYKISTNKINAGYISKT